MKINVGTRFRYGHADANPDWEVTRSAGRGIWECVIVDCPDYSGHTRLFKTKEIKAVIGFDSFLNKLHNDGEEFYRRLPAGSIVHYNNGFQNYVRCRVTADKQLMPIALVGSWQQYDLPRRQKDGTIAMGYYPTKILTKEAFKPNASNVYEYNLTRNTANRPIGFAGWIDPRRLSPVSLEVPDMTPEQERIANLWQQIDCVKSVLNSSEQNPAKILAHVKQLVS